MDQPNPGHRGRLIATGALSVAAGALWMCGASLPGTEPTPMLIGIGLIAPWAVSLPTLALMERRIARDDRRAPIERQHRTERERVR
jgi:hypothetical protein